MPPATPDKPGKIYVGNLPNGIQKEEIEQEIEQTFSKYGEIKDTMLIVDRESGLTKGFAFLTYNNPSDADDAVNGMNEQDFRGRSLKVSHALMAISKQRGGDRGGRGGRGGPMGRGSLLGGPLRGRGGRGGGFDSRGGRGGGFDSRGGYEPRGRGGFSRGGLRGGPPRGRGGPPSRGGSRGGYNGPQGRPLMGGDDYGDDRGMGRGAPRGAPRGRGRGEPLLSQPPLMGDDYRGGAPERDDYGAPPMAERGGRAPRGAPPSRDDYGHEQTTEYGAAGRSAPPAREYPESRGDYAREDPYGASRERGGYGAAREPLVRDPPPREPAAREPRGYSRDYSSNTSRDSYGADPYAAQTAAPERSSYEYGASREDPYGAARSAVPPTRSAYEEPRREPARDYERQTADRGYGKEYSAYAEPARQTESYSRAAPAERDYGSGGASRYEGYGSRDPYGARAERGEKAPYGSRDPYGSSAAAPAARSASGGRGYERHY